MKYFKFRYNDKWFVYEALPEEGEGVKKKLLDCIFEEEADEYLEEFRSAFKKCLADNLKIVDIEKRTKMPTIKEIKRKVVTRLMQNAPKDSQ